METQFIQACNDDQHDVVDDMLSKGYVPPPESIIVPCRKGYLDMVIKLLKYPMMVQQGLFEAVRNSHLHLLDHLYVDGANINYVNGYVGTALHNARKPGIVTWLLDMGAQHLPDGDGSYPLNRACYDSVVTVKTLLQRGAPQLPNDYGCTPLHDACYHSSIRPVKLLLDHGGQQLPDNDGDTPLHTACGRGNIATAELLLDRGGQQLPNNDGTTPLHIACKNKDIDMIKLLLTRGGQQLANKDGNTPLHIACTVGLIGNNEIVKLLLDHGGHQIANIQGMTPLDLAKQCCNHKLIKLLKQ